MKRSLFAIALVSGVLFMASSAFANPALLKSHDGYPNEGKGTTATGDAALEQSLGKATPKTMPDEVKAAEEDTRAGNVITDDPRQRTHPGYPDHGVSENHIKNATKVNAEPK